MIHAYKNYDKLPFINDIYCVFFKGFAAVSYFVPAMGLITGASLTGGRSLTFQSTDENVYRTGHRKLKDLNETINQMQEAVKSVQEEVHTKKRKMHNIFQATKETHIHANYINSKIDPKFNDLKTATNKLEALCTEYIGNVEKEKNKKNHELLD